MIPTQIQSKAAIGFRSTLTRRQLFGRLLAFGALPVGAGFYATQVEPFWPKFPEVQIRLKGLPRSFENFRIAQVSDMHTGRVPYSYLERVIRQVKKLKPDLIAVTGDLIHHNPDYVQPLLGLLANLPAPALVSFGNHDYAPNRGEDDPCDPYMNEKLERGLTGIGCHVLRNASLAITHDDGQLWFVGLDDLWFGDFDPGLAFLNVPGGVPVIALSHNPDTAEMLAPQHPDLILSGHTHGGQIRLPHYGPLRLNVEKPQYDMGHFHLPQSQLYVSSGVGYIQRVRFYCRPEVPIFVLTA